MLVVALLVVVILPVTNQPSLAQGGTPAATMVATAAGTAAPTLRPGAKPIKVGLHVPLTGPLAFLGEGYRWGVTLAMEDLGKQIEGYPLELVEAEGQPHRYDQRCAKADRSG